MRVLLDTNLLTRIANPTHTQTRDLAEKSIDMLRKNGHVACLVPQNLYEFWAVATRPLEANGLGMSVDDARSEVDALLQLFHVFQDERAIFSRWLDLVTGHDTKGKASHDARLVAAMLRHGLTHLLTFNDGDFSRYSDVKAVTPEGVVSGAVSL